MPAVILNVKVEDDQAQAKFKNLNNEVNKFGSQKIGNPFDKLEGGSKSAFNSTRLLQSEWRSLAGNIPVVGRLFNMVGTDIFKFASSSSGQIEKLQNDLQKLKGRLSDFGRGVQIKFGGAIDTAFLKQVSEAKSEGERLELIAARFGKAWEKNVVPVEQAALQFRQVEREGVAALSNIESKAGKLGVSLNELETGTDAVSGKMGGLSIRALALVAALVAVIAVIGLFALKTASVGDEIYKVGQKTSFSTETLSVLRVQAQEAGNSFKEFSSALPRFEKNVYSAANGNQKLAETFRILGVDVKNLSPEEAFKQFLIGFSRIDDDAQRASIAIQLFGRSGANLIPTFDRIGDKFGEAEEHARALGQVMGRDAVEASHNFEVKLRDAKLGLEGLVLTIGGAVLPAVSTLLSMLVKGAPAILAAAAAFGVVTLASRVLIPALAAVTAETFSLSAAIKGLFITMGPAGWVALIVGLVVALTSWSNSAREVNVVSRETLELTQKQITQTQAQITAIERQGAATEAERKQREALLAAKREELAVNQELAKAEEASAILALTNALKNQYEAEQRLINVNKLVQGGVFSPKALSEQNKALEEANGQVKEATTGISNLSEVTGKSKQEILSHTIAVLKAIQGYTGATEEGQRLISTLEAMASAGRVNAEVTNQQTEALKKYEDSIGDLNLQILFFGQSTHRAAVEQEYLKEKGTDAYAALNEEQRKQSDTLYQWKLAAADQLDKLEAQKKASDAAKNAVENYSASLKELQAEVQYFGNTTHRAAVEQDFLKLKTEGLTAAALAQLKVIYEQKLALADQLDQKEAQKKAAEDAAKANEFLAEQMRIAKDAVHDLGAGNIDSQKHLEAFNRALAKQKDAALLNADAIKAAREAMQEWDDAEDRARVRRERNQRVKSFDDFGAEGIRNLTEQLRDLKSLDGPDEVAKIFSSFEKIGDIRLKGGAFDSLLQFINQLEAAGRGDELPLERLAVMIKDVFEAAHVDLGPNGQLDATSRQLAQMILLARDLAKEQTPLARATHDLNQQFHDLQQEVPIAAETASLRYRNVWLAAINDVKLADMDAVASQIQSQVKLADATIVHSEQVRASVLSHLASQKSITEAWSDGIISAYDRITGFIDKGIDKLTHGLSIVNDILKSIVHQLLNRVFQRLLDLLFPATGGSGAQAGGSSGGGGGILGWLGKLVGGLFNSKSSASPLSIGPGGTAVFNPNAGFNFGGNSSGFSLGGGVNSSSVSSVLSSLSGGGGGLTPPITVEQAAQQSEAASFVHEALHIGGSGGTAKSGLSLSNLAESIGPLLPLLGASLGAGVGGSSVTGQILGGAGGLLLGMGGEALISLIASTNVGGVTGGAATLLSGLGFSAGAATAALFGVGGVLLLSAYLLNRNNQRRKNEETRTELSGKVYDDTIKILNKARAGGYNSLSEVMSDWASVKSTYFAGIAKFDSKTKRIATDWWNHDFAPYYEPLLIQGFNDGEEAKKRDKLLTPEFRDGGLVGRFADGGLAHPMFANAMSNYQVLPDKYLGRVPGVYDRKDNIQVAVSGDEAILPPKVWKPITPYLKAMKLPGFADGGALPEASIPRASSSQQDSGDISINIGIEFDGEKFVLKVLDSPEGRKVTLKTVGSYDGKKVTTNNNRAARNKGVR